MAPSSSQLPLLAVLAMVVCATVQLQLPSSCEAMPSRNHDLLMLGRFHRWMSAHNRSYAGPDEKLRRFDVYRRNVEYIDAANAAGELGYELGENEFTDLTHQEFMAHYTGGRFEGGGVHEDAAAYRGTTITTLVGDVDEGRRETMERVNSVPDNFDWNEKGYVTPAKNQKGCGACWAFAAAGAIESQLKIATGKGKRLDLSEQELIDCDRTEIGCMGGLPYRAFKWIKKKGGMLKESEYPYEAQDGQCRRISKRAIRQGKITTIGHVAQDEEELQDAVYRWGPTTVGIDSQDPNLKHFKSGIYKGPCGTNLDHAVLVVGYGVNEESGEKYWVVKNSWGQTWGENGFFLMSRGENGKTGLCGIALNATFVQVMH